MRATSVWQRVLGVEHGPGELPDGPDRDEVAARVLRTLAMVGDEEAWEKIRQFATTHRSRVIDELLRAWRQFDHDEEYAPTLLSPVDFGDLVLEVRRWELLASLRHLTTLSAVKLVGKVPLADLPALRGIELAANEEVRQLEPLTRCPRLRWLRVSNYSVLTDLSALARTGVDELHLHPLGGSPDLGTLAGTGIRRLSVHHPALADGLTALPADLPLVELAVDGRAEHRSLLGVQRWPGLTRVRMAGVPGTEEVRALGELPALRHLEIRAPRPGEDLVRLRVLKALREVDLYDVEEDLPVADLLPGVDVRVHRRAQAGIH